MSKVKAIIAGALIGMFLLIGSIYPSLTSQPTSQPQVSHPIADVTPTPGGGAPPACTGSSCGG